MYLCRDLELGDHEVPVKATPLSSSEASILGRFNHPNITPVYSTGFCENLQFLLPLYAVLRSQHADGLARHFISGWSLPLRRVHRRGGDAWLADEQRGSPAKRWPLAAWGHSLMSTAYCPLRSKSPMPLSSRIRITSYMAI